MVGGTMPIYKYDANWNYMCYSKSTESGNQQNSCVWSKISYWIFYQALTKYIYLESARQDLQNGEKI